jgi:hypothetical protein
LDEADEDEDHGNNEEDVDESANRIGSHQSQSPENEKNHGDGYKHKIFIFTK